MSKIKEMLMHHEGIRLKPYRCTSGKYTIGIGRNLEDTGISKDEALYLLDNDIREHWKQLITFPWFLNLNQPRIDVLLDMHFNLGHSRFCKFTGLIEALEARDYCVAAYEMLNSRWAKQVGCGLGQRANTLATIMYDGEY